MTELDKAVEAYIDNPANYLEYQNEWEDLSDLEYVEKAFIAGANWQKEQFEKIENYTEEGWNSNSKDEEFIYGISFDEPIKLPVEFYVKKK